MNSRKAMKEPIRMTDIHKHVSLTFMLRSFGLSQLCLKRKKKRKSKET